MGEWNEMADLMELAVLEGRGKRRRRRCL